MDAVNFQPVWLLSCLPPEYASSVWLATTIAGLVFACLMARKNDSLLLRLTTTFFLLAHFSIEDSRDSIRHGEHSLLWTTLILSSLPVLQRSEDASRRRCAAYLRRFGLAQFMLLFFYFMAGVVKVVTAVVQLVNGERTLFHPDAGALIISEWLLRGDASSLMGRWCVEHNYASWLGVLGGVSIELLAITPILWRRLQSVVGIGLICMHIGIGLSMDVWFPENVGLLALLILAGPSLATSTLQPGNS